MKREEKIILLFKNLVVAYIVTFVVLAILSFIAYRLELKDKTISMLLVVSYIGANFIGGFLTGRKIKEKKFLWGMVLAACYFVVFSILAIGFHGISSFATANTVTTFVLCLASGMLGGMLS